MFGNDKKRNGHTVAAITTLIAEGTVIRGDIEFNGGLHMDGKVEGSVSAQGDKAVLTLSDKGCITGEIRAPNAIINGKVIGDIFVSDRLELAAHARVEGNVYYKVLEMAAGAQLNGKMIYQDETPRQLSGPDKASEKGKAKVEAAGA